MNGRGKRSLSSPFRELSPYVSPSLVHEFGLSVPHQPTCHANHLPPYLEKYGELKTKGVDVIAVIAANDPFVMSGWGRVEGVEDKV